MGRAERPYGPARSARLAILSPAAGRPVIEAMGWLHRLLIRFPRPGRGRAMSAAIVIRRPADASEKTPILTHRPPAAAGRVEAGSVDHDCDARCLSLRLSPAACHQAR